MMSSSIKAIEARSIHQIQSGQVIVDLCSVVKELVENSLDAGATSIDVRFKNNGLQAIEVQDNGDGISPDNYESVALKHYTSKLSTYADLTSLQTFGFRGEALSSLCALATVHITTAQASEAPKGTKLEFDTSGKLKGTSTIASQKGTAVVVEGLFNNLPVRRRELEKNVKREYNKVLGILNAYACISASVRFSVSNQVTKGKKTIAFATKANPTTRENIANVFGAKTLKGLVPLDLKLELQPTTSTQNFSDLLDEGSKEIRIVGHISRPVVGEGRQLPDRQMFFVNSRPCILPQVTKAFNEVYKSYNISQSPFIFADLRLDTNAYDVNVSPDKRTILLHDQNALLESLKTTLTELFESTDQTVPQTQGPSQKLPAFKQLTINRAPPTVDENTLTLISLKAPEEEKENSSGADDGTAPDCSNNPDTGDANQSRSRTNRQRDGQAVSLVQTFMDRKTVNRPVASNRTGGRRPVLRVHQPKIRPGDQDSIERRESDGLDSRGVESGEEDNVNIPAALIPVRDFNRRIAEQEGKSVHHPPRSPFVQDDDQGQIPSTTVSPSRPPPGIVQSAFNHMRPKRAQEQTATVTIGSTIVISPIGTPAAKRRRMEALEAMDSSPTRRTGVTRRDVKSQNFGKGLRSFAAPGTQTERDENENEEDDMGYGDKKDRQSEISLTKEDAQQRETGQDNSIGDKENIRPEGGGFYVDAEAGDAEEREGDHSDEEYLDEAANKAKEDQKVRDMIRKAEEDAARPSQESLKRADVLKGNRRKRDSTVQLVKRIDTSVAMIEGQMSALDIALESSRIRDDQAREEVQDRNTQNQTSAEERLSLTVSKEDFARMRIIGQFNLGFIIALRPAAIASPSSPSQTSSDTTTDELFIIDQHASDEKYNFERLQSRTFVQSQPLVRPLPLSLTVVEEEIATEHLSALEKNGFLLSIDQEAAVGHRCHLLALPMSKEVVFGMQDLEELIGLLADSPAGTVPRPSKVRRMFAMRACRSSVMIGKTLKPAQMQTLVRHMGEIDKPWNCPHGRPTMRHLLGLGRWQGWEEGDGLVGIGEVGCKVDWNSYVRGEDRDDRGEAMEDYMEDGDD